MKSPHQIAAEIVEAWPYHTGIKSAHKATLVVLIAEKLSEQRQEGYAAGMKDWKPDTKSPYEL